MNTTNTIDSFTGDIIAFLDCSQDRDELRRLIRRREPTNIFIRGAVIDALAPTMLQTPPLVQQIVGRALMRHVDWQAVAQWATVNPEDN
jgi:hypothetical protein